MKPLWVYEISNHYFAFAIDVKFHLVVLMMQSKPYCYILIFLINFFFFFYVLLWKVGGMCGSHSI
jgi:hypothetical protein